MFSIYVSEEKMKQAVNRIGTPAVGLIVEREGRLRLIISGWGENYDWDNASEAELPVLVALGDIEEAAFIITKKNAAWLQRPRTTPTIKIEVSDKVVTLEAASYAAPSQ